MAMSSMRFGRSSWTARLALLAVILVVVITYRRPLNDLVLSPLGSQINAERFENLSVTGYANLRLQHGFRCSDIAVFDEISVAPIVDIDDDIYEIAKSVTHPAVDYSGQKKGLALSEMIDKTWGRLSGSSVWLEDQQVYLTVTRVYFYKQGVRKWPAISFLRGQVHDAQWNELKNYELKWQDETIIFPRMFDIPIPYKIDDGFMGPEDPRIIVERGVPNAEPVIVFNMLDNMTSRKRSMFIFRPFSGYTVKLTRGDDSINEKNWAPFFKDPIMDSKGKPRASKQLHFLYEYDPLTIERCNLISGSCERVFRMKDPPNFDYKKIYLGGVMRGGTQYERLDLPDRPGITSYIGFPRTHIDEGCTDEAVYRPEITILSTDGKEFWFDYASEGLSFGKSLLNETELEDPCVTGRILIANSIARIDDRKGKDEIMLTYSVNDMTVEVASIRGVYKLARSLPQYERRGPTASHIKDGLEISHRVVGCSIESAANFTVASTTPKMWDDAKKKIEEDEKKKKAEEEKKKKEKELKSTKQDSRV